MDQQNVFSNELDKEKLSTLKTLTILTFIGAGLGLLFSIYGFFAAETGYEKMQEAINNGQVNQMPSFLRDMYSPERMEIMRKNIENKVPILILGLASGFLCIFGAIKMRQQKADGYWLWLIGELLPFLATAFFLGVQSLFGFFNYIMYAIVITFIILYTSQRKYLS